MSWWKAALGIGTGAAGGWMLPLLGLGASTFGNIYASRRQSGANRDALAYQREADARAAQIEAEERAEQRREFDLQQAQAEKAWNAQQKFEADKWAASEDERLYQRTLSDKNQRLLDEREARRAPYRAASASALASLPDIIARGRATPGLASLGSYRRQ